MADEITLTTLETVSGSDIEQHIGLVTGVAVAGTSMITSFVANLKHFFGGENTAMTSLLQDTRKKAMDHMVEEAKKLGANAVINIRIESSKIASGTAEVCVYGTAVKMIKY
jgi:uncharacterized protein YbjQ (UPF0145 family)